MNPSSSGWIKKLLKDVSDTSYWESDTYEFYNSLKKTGFIYGSNVAVVNNFEKNHDLSEEEKCKVNMVLAFYFIYKQHKREQKFITSLVAYYKEINEQKRAYLGDLFGDSKPDQTLEKIIHKRIHIDDNIISKTFSYFLINALLFVDVLGYEKYLQGHMDSKNYVYQFENVVETIVFKVLESKTKKTEYDTNLMKLFESSLRQKNNEKPKYDDVVKVVQTQLEKFYIIDTVCMASWSDKVIDREEQEFLFKLQVDLNLKSKNVIKSVDDINAFYMANRANIAFLSSKNLAQSFYDNSSKIVMKLIKRNSKRLLKELSESKEAMVLLTKSTTRNLTDEEQKKVQEQLLDIFKSIPSLAIFMLPGGMLLLPLFVKFIPKLLPSAFDDNRIEED